MMLFKVCREIFVVHGNGDAELRTAVVKQAGVTTGLVVDVKTGALERAENRFRFEHR